MGTPPPAGGAHPPAILRWTADDLRRQVAVSCFAMLTAATVRPIPGERVYWDSWPLLTAGGERHWLADGTELWFALSAPRTPDPLTRHELARIWLLSFDGRRFHPLGPALPDGLSPGSREWSGSAALDVEGGRVTLWFTAAGRRGEEHPTYEQRLFATTGRLEDGRPTGWSEPSELLRAEGDWYAPAVEASGSVGAIKGFRDPEPAAGPDGGRVVLFTGSSARAPSAHDGVIGRAHLRADGSSEALPPLVDATGFNNELERPHLRPLAGRWYLFWSTQAHVFAPGVVAPTGLYGAVADAPGGPFRLVNGGGLIAGNPPARPRQAYSWLVLPDGEVTGFVDELGEPPAFVGTVARFGRLACEGERVRLIL